MRKLPVEIKQRKSPALHWTKIVRAGQELPLPCQVWSSLDVPGKHLSGYDYLSPGDFLIEGEENIHGLGWTYSITYCSDCPDRDIISFTVSHEVNLSLKSQGMPPEYLSSSREISNAVRVIHAIRLGFKVTKEFDICGHRSGLNGEYVCKMPKGSKCPDCSTSIIDFPSGG